jgi:hypothetical protein
MGQKNILNINVGGIIIQINIEDDRVFYYLKARLKSYDIFVNDPLFTVLIKKREFYTFNLISNYWKKNYEIKLFIAGNDLDPLFFVLKVFISQFCIFNNILFLHASSIAVSNKTYLFSGPSGAGKSTIASNFNSQQVLSEDTAILREINGSFFVFSSPFDYKKLPNIEFCRFPLGKIFFIFKSKENLIKPINKLETIIRLLMNNFIYQYFYPLRVFSKKDKQFIKFFDRLKIISNFYQDKYALKKLILNKLHKLSVKLAINYPQSKLYFTKNIKLENLKLKNDSVPH